jgi:phospholipid-binding lipoprotein MlaA
MLPLLGPSTLRDTTALPVDIVADPWGAGISARARNLGTVVRVIDQRAVLLDATNLLEEAALDRYEFIRDGYLQQRQSKVFDGEGSRKEARAARLDQDEPSAKSISAAYEDPEPAAEPPKPQADKPEASEGAPPAPATPLSSESASK